MSEKVLMVLYALLLALVAWGVFFVHGLCSVATSTVLAGCAYVW